jgi:hypothetical protein
VSGASGPSSAQASDTDSSAELAIAAAGRPAAIPLRRKRRLYRFRGSTVLIMTSLSIAVDG